MPARTLRGLLAASSTAAVLAGCVSAPTFVDRNIGAAARMAIKDPKFGSSGELSPETQAAINAAIRAGDPRIILLPGRLETPLIDLAFEGAAKIDPANVSAEMKVTADSLDKTLALAM